jgi:hypothetical protein
MPKETELRPMRDCDNEVSTKNLVPLAKVKKVEAGIAIRPTGQSVPATVVKMPKNIRDKVLEWFVHPTVFEDPREYLRIRSALIETYLTIIQIMVQYGNPDLRTVLEEFLKEEFGVDIGRSRRRIHRHTKRARKVDERGRSA